jgi:hypothetical protein
MIVATVWHGRDAYDHTIYPMLHQTFKNLSDENLKDMIAQHEKYVKSGTLPWYLITVTRFDVGGEPISETFHRANPVKTKIVLNARAKVDPKQKKIAGTAGLWAQINAMEGYQPAFAGGAVPVAVPANLNDVWINP